MTHEGLVRFQYLGRPRVVEVGPRSYHDIAAQHNTVLIDDESEDVYAHWREITLDGELPPTASDADEKQGIPEVEAVSGDDGSLPPGCEVVGPKGGWYKAFNAVGEQVGKSVRSREEALDLLMGG
jgi:hypothetical protein